MKDGKALPTATYKGVRDFYPEDMFIENYIFNILKSAVQKFGFEEYDASPLEPTELYEGKTSDEIVRDQTYTFTDRGGRSVTLRPEMTPTIARMVAARRRDIATPLRLFSTPNVFRYERPQKGRLREHRQLNCDIFGGSSQHADIEIISLAHHIMRTFKLTEKQFIIKINSRQAIRDALMQRKIPANKEKEVHSLRDKRGKIPEQEFDALLHELGADNLQIEESDDCKIVRETLAKRGIHNVIFDASLERGFDYYTGMIFEVFDTDEKNSRSVFGGGRYDNLMSLFGAEPLPAVGFGMGNVTIKNTLETYNLLPAYQPACHLLIASIAPENAEGAVSLAESLRQRDLNVAVDTTERKVKDKIKSASKLGILHLVCIGDDEEKTHSYTVKNLKTGEETIANDDTVRNIIFSQHE